MSFYDDDIPLSPEENAVAMWVQKRHKLLKQSKYNGRPWFEPDFTPPYEDARQAMYYENECRREMKTSSQNPYRSTSICRITSFQSDGSPQSVAPDFRGKDPLFNKSINNRIENMMQKYETDSDGRISRAYRLDELPDHKVEEVRKMIQIESRFRSQALGTDLIDFKEKPIVTLEAEVETAEADLSLHRDIGAENSDDSDDSDKTNMEITRIEQRDKEEQESAPEDEDEYDRHDRNEEIMALFGSSEYLPSHLGWIPDDEDEINIMRASVSKTNLDSEPESEPEPEEEPELLIHISSLVLEDENEEEFNPDPVEKRRIKESFFEGFDEEEEDRYQEFKPQPRERGMRQKDLDKYALQTHRPFRDEWRGTARHSKWNQYEDDDVYQQLQEQNEYTEDEDDHSQRSHESNEEWRDPVQLLGARAYTREKSFPPSYDRNEERQQFKEEYEWLRARHPRFFQTLGEQSQHQPFASVPSVTPQDFEEEEIRSKRQIKRQERKLTEKKANKKQNEKQMKPKVEWTTDETLGQFFRNRFPVSSGNPTIKSESDHPINPNIEITKGFWGYFVRFTGSLVESDVDLILFKSCFNSFPILNIALTLLLLTLLCVGKFMEFQIAIMSSLMTFMGASIFSTGNSLYFAYRQYKKRKKSREDDLRKLKPRIRYDTSRHPSHPAVAGLKFSQSGSSTTRRKKKRFHIERPRISEMEIDLIGERPYLPVILDNSAKIMALVDSGSTSCAIRPSILAKLEEKVPVPRATKEYKLKGVIPGATKSGKDIAFVTLELQKGYIVRNIPMVVMDTGVDVLIGSNLIRSHRWANYWKEGKYFIDIGRTPHKSDSPYEYNSKGEKVRKRKEPIEAHFLPSSVVKGISMAAMVLEPQEKRIIPLKIPALDNMRNTNFHNSDLMAIDIDEKAENPVLKVFAGKTRMIKKCVAVQVKNTSDQPVFFEKGMEIANIQISKSVEDGGEVESIDITSLLHTKKAYEAIPTVVPMADTCHCEIGKDKENPRVTIQIADKFGLTSTADNLVTTVPHEYNSKEVKRMEPLKPGLHLRKHYADDDLKEIDPLYTILIVPDEEGGFTAVTRRETKTIGKKISGVYSKKNQPAFYFVSPMTEVSFSTMKMMTDMHKILKYQFIDVRYSSRHPECVNFSMRQFPPEIITGTHITKLHIQSGNNKPPPELLRKDKGSPIFKTSVMGATLFMFKLGLFLTCHLHIPTGTEAAAYSINWKERMLYTFFHELRRIRVPTDFHITMDGNPAPPELKHLTNAFRRVLFDTTNRLPPFLEANERCFFPTPEVGDEEVVLPPKGCGCRLCKEPPDKKLEEGFFDIFEGNISKVTQQPRPPSSYASSGSQTQPIAMISSFTAVDEAEFDIPLDPLGIVDEEELYKFINTHPGCENDGPEPEKDEKKPPKPKPTSTADPIRLIERNPPPGIPDSFVPGDWRDFVNVDVMDISDQAKKKVTNLLDRFVNILSCRKTDCRPIYIDGKPVEVDIELMTEKPIFIKPYTTADRMSKVLDEKIDEMLDKNEIVQVDSPYNIPILLTHHNSENKHIAFEDRKFRLCLDLRCVNSLTKLKNIDSHHVKKIEHLYAKVHGKKFFTVIDMTKAYRSLIASEHLRQICAFRTPDSTKYPYHTWAFRSTPDGLAILPGFYSLCIQKCLSKESRECVIQHIDDLLIASDDEETHLRDIERVFNDLLKGNFLISAPKLKMFKREVLFLGHVINGSTLDIPEERRSYFDSLQPPTTKKEMQSLLGVAGYMAHFVKNYHLNTGPLFDALKGRGDKQSFTLDEEQMKAFQELKLAIKNAEKLHIIDFDQKIYMETDSSLTGTGSILYQEYQDPDDPPGSRPRRRIIRYGYRRFSITESLHHTSLEREAMGILIGCKIHYYYLFNCPEAIIKTDLKSLITLLSCYNNPDSSRMARLSHRLYSLPFKWSLIHVPGVDIPLADALSRLYPPYRCAFSDRHLRYPDLRRSDIVLPEEWTKDPNIVLTTQDILEAMRKNIVFIEKSSLQTKVKRLRAFAGHLSMLHENMGSEIDPLAERVQSELNHIELSAKEHKLAAPPRKKKVAKPASEEDNDEEEMDIFAMNTEEKSKPLTSVSPRVLITPAFITKHQNEDERLHAIIMHLKTTPKGELKTKVVKKYRLLNDSILCTRKDKRLPFDAPGNLRIVCNHKMTLIIMSILHIMGGHYGINTLIRLFSLTYKTKGSIQAFAKIVCLGCRSCRLHRPVNKRNIPYGRIPIPSEPNHTWHMDHVIWKKESGFWRGKKFEGALNIVDLHSNLLISYLVKDVKAETTISCMKQAFSIMPAPLKIVSDNATGLCANIKVANFLRRKGVQNVATITPYNSKGNKSERMHKILRETLQLVMETFKRKSVFDMYTTVVEMINSRPLTLTNHPHIRPLIKDSKEIVTPFSLHYGTRPPPSPLAPLEEDLDPQERNEYKQKWQRILAEHDRLLQ